MVKLETDADRLSALQKSYQIEVLDNHNDERLVVQVAGTSPHIDTFLHDVGTDNIVEVARSGFTAIEK